MRTQSRANRVAFRRAVWASVAIHSIAALALVLFVRTEKRTPTVFGLDTRAVSEPQVRMSLPEVEVSIEPPAPSAPSQPQPPMSAPAQPQAPEPTLPTESTSPLAAARVPAPQTLPPEMLTLIRKPVPQAAVADPNVKPAGGPSGTDTNATTAPAIHGALNPNQTVVYVLDCSGSMGASGKFDAARAALVSTLKQQPATVRFQIITYAGSATPLLASNGAALPATDANVRAAADKLAQLEARGKSNHLAAVRAALAFRPDVILLLTDADDLDAAALKPVLASAPKVVPVCVGQVTAGGVQRPRELK